jgi:hypothetical protein
METAQWIDFFYLLAVVGMVFAFMGFCAWVIHEVLGRDRG